MHPCGELMRYLLLPFTPRYILLTISLLGTLALAAVALIPKRCLPSACRWQCLAVWLSSAFAT